MDFEGSEAGIVKNQRNLKVLGVLAGRRRDSLQGLTTARPGANIVENVRFWRLGAWNPQNNEISMILTVLRPE